MATNTANTPVAHPQKFFIGGEWVAPKRGQIAVQFVALGWIAE